MADFPTPLPPIKQFKLLLKFSLMSFKKVAPEISIDSILSTISFVPHTILHAKEDPEKLCG